MTEVEAEAAGVCECDMWVLKAAAAMAIAVWTRSAVAKMAARAKAVTKVVRDESQTEGLHESSKWKDWMTM